MHSSACVWRQRPPRHIYIHTHRTYPKARTLREGGRKAGRKIAGSRSYRHTNSGRSTSSSRTARRKAVSQPAARLPPRPPCQCRGGGLGCLVRPTVLLAWTLHSDLLARSDRKVRQPKQRRCDTSLTWLVSPSQLFNFSIFFRKELVSRLRLGKSYKLK